MYTNEYSAGGIILNEKKVVLVFENKTQMWAFPKGHIEYSESELEAALREIREETGLTNLKLILKLGNYTRHTKKSPQIIKQIVMFLFKTEDQYIFPNANDIVRVEWVRINDVQQKLSYSEDIKFFNEKLSLIKRYL